MNFTIGTNRDRNFGHTLKNSTWLITIDKIVGYREDGIIPNHDTSTGLNGTTSEFSPNKDNRASNGSGRINLAKVRTIPSHIS